MSLWSMKKDPDLESALSRNRRWVVNNQIKNIVLRCPNQVASVKLLQRKFKTLDLQLKDKAWSHVFHVRCPLTWVKSWDRFHEFNSTPYVSPYSDPGGLMEGSKEMDKRTVGIFYVSNTYQIYTVLLRDEYKGSELIDKDPLVVVKEKFGELMQEGLHEYNQRHYFQNLEKNRKKGIIPVRPE
ncbi:hypothetical protein POM88_003666 [Heracleum sosnowskyi]|uniref:PORR domain-containing protein n=1 Tax=Heracleum sosnowskyi TaxID=360622 RepID=A0AAD8JI25_9APIA|nr:hypothetical protein POM88_003666 [Heracleum sosnowskyi]